jgi:Zn-dependent metalloprotease
MTRPPCCFVPPSVLEEIARRGDDAQRDAALRTLAVDQTVRTARLHNLGLAQPMADALRAVVGPKDHPNRTIRDAENTRRLDGPVLRNEGSPASGDEAADEAYDGLGATWDLFARVYDRNSIDDQGVPLEGVVHFERDYDNAFWDGHRMVFGDGDGTLFNRFTIAVEVIGHELTHGVTGAELGLNYMGEAGALNESISDVFGVLVKQYLNKETAEKADWLIGAGLLRPSVHGVALRSMKAPGTADDDPVLGKDPQPAHMDDFVKTTADNGGVHINSGIPNRAFYLAATTIGGHAWERAGQIWYDTLHDPKLRPGSKFVAFARSTVRSAIRRFGADGEETAAVKAAWEQVGVKI